MEVGRSSGAIVTDKTGKVCKPPTRAGNKYLFYPKKYDETLMASSSSPLAKQDLE